MALVAVLSARSATVSATGATQARRRGELAYAGQPVVEFQARQAHAVGAGHIAILVEDVSPVLTGVIDRLGDDGIRATLVRDMPALGRMISGEDEILLVGDGQILPNAHLAGLADAPGPRLLVLPAGPATEGLERIDAGHMWAGAARAPAPTVLSILDMLGDWDLPLTLVRRLVQDGAARTLCDISDLYEGRMVVATDQAVADAATEALTRRHGGAAAVSGDLDDWPVTRPATMLAPVVVRHGIAASTIRAGAIATALLAILLIGLGLPVLGLLLTFGAMIADRTAGQLDRLLRMVPTGQAANQAVHVLTLLAILVMILRYGGGTTLGNAAALLLVGLLALAPFTVARGIGTSVPSLLRFAPGTAVLILLGGALLGFPGAAAALCAGLAFASHACLILLPAGDRAPATTREFSAF